MQTVYWLVIFVVLLIIEIVTMGLTTIWFAGGALAAFFVGDRAACDSDILYQDRKAGTGIGYRKTGRLPDDMGHRTSF